MNECIKEVYGMSGTHGINGIHGMNGTQTVEVELLVGLERTNEWIECVSG